ncbi:DUF397 domain-containing protein [Micromonospora sp. NPDC004336]
MQHALQQLGGIHAPHTSAHCAIASTERAARLGDNLPGVVPIRDSKDRSGPTLSFDPVAWSRFVTGLAERHPR